MIVSIFFLGWSSLTVFYVLAIIISTGENPGLDTLSKQFPDLLAKLIITPLALIIILDSYKQLSFDNISLFMKGDKQFWALTSLFYFIILNLAIGTYLIPIKNYLLSPGPFITNLITRELTYLYFIVIMFVGIFITELLVILNISKTTWIFKPIAVIATLILALTLYVTTLGDLKRISKIDINHHHYLYGTRLHLGVKKGNFQEVKYLLERGANIDALYKQTQNTPLHVACEYGHLQIVEILIKRGADLTVANGQNMTPLQIAVKEKFPKIIKLLVSNGANVKIKK